MRYLLLLILLTGCSQASGYEPDTNEAAAIVAAQIAFHEPQHVDDSQPQTKCDECKGTGKVRSRDGHAIVPCSCGEHCQCEKTQAVQDSRLVVTVYYAKDFYCPPCETLKQNLHRVPYVRFVDKSGSDPWWIEAYPTLHWSGDDGQEYQLASGDINEFVSKLRQYNPSLFENSGRETNDASNTGFIQVPQQPAMVTRRGRIISRGCRGGRCR